MLLSSYAKAVVCTDGFAYNSVDRETLASMITCEKYVSPIDDALRLAIMIAKSENCPIVICGSLYITELFRKMI